MTGIFSPKKTSHGGQTFLDKFVGGGRLFYMGGLMSDPCQVGSRGGGSFIKNFFSSNQNNLNLKIFFNHGGVFT